MQINHIKRPFGSSSTNGHRHNNRTKNSFYQSAAWRKTRNAFIAANPNCVECGKPATVADHKVRIKDGGDPLNWNNLAAMCKKCHDSKDNNAGKKK